MSATLLGNVASGIATRLSTISGLKVYSYEPGGAGLDALPAACVGRCDVRRTETDDFESQLGTNDWRVEFAVTLYVQLDDPATAYAAARTLIGQAVAAIDADRSLGGVALDASLTVAEMGFTGAETPRQMVIVECAVEALCLV